MPLGAMALTGNDRGAGTWITNRPGSSATAPFSGQKLLAKLASGAVTASLTKIAAGMT